MQLIDMFYCSIQKYIIRIPARSEYSLQSYLPLSAQKYHIWPCLEHDLFSFDRLLMRLAVNLDRHKISDKFEFRPVQTIDFWVTCPLVRPNPIFSLVHSIVF